MVNHSFKYLENTYYKLTVDKYLTVGFLGGSVTDGYGASNQAKKAWPRLVVDKLQSEFSAYVTEERKSIGGTGSALAPFRYEHDLKSAKPDLLFIEFAINDCYQGYSYDEVVRYSESIVRKAYSLNPYIDIVYVLTCDNGTKDSDYEQLRAHRDVANKYGLLCIKLADGLFAEMKSLRNVSPEMGKISIKIDNDEPIILDAYKGNSTSNYSLYKLKNDEHSVEIVYIGEQTCEFRISALLYN